MGLNFVGPLIHGFFSIVNTTVLHDPWLLESADAEPQIQRADCGLEHPWILASEVGSGTNPLQILRDRLHFNLLAAIPTSCLSENYMVRDSEDEHFTQYNHDE